MKPNQRCRSFLSHSRTTVNTERVSAFITANWRILVIICISVLEAVLNLGRRWPDSKMYVSLSDFFLGKNPKYLEQIPQPYTSSPRRPAIPFLASLLMPTLGIQLSYGIINTFFWVGAAIISYKTAEILSDRDRAFLSALLFTTSVPMIAYGSSILTDVGGYFAVGASLYMCLYERGKTMRRRTYFIQALLLAVACLINEMAIFGLLFLLFVRARERKGTTETLMAAGIVVAGVVLVILSNPYYSKFMAKAFEHYTTTYVSLLSGPRYSGGKYPTFPDALIWTFRLYSPLASLLSVPIVDLFATYTLRYFFLIFIVLLAVGLYDIPEKGTTYSYLPFLALYVFISRLNYERYLFALWPVFVPALICGSHRLVRYLLASILKLYAATIRVVSRVGFIADRQETRIHKNLGSNATRKIRRLSSLVLAVWLIYQAYDNTLDIALQFGLSPVLIDVLRSLHFP